MYNELYQYLIQYKQLALPGIGTFSLERKPAEADFPNRIINPPAYIVIHRQAVNSPSRKIFTWLASSLHISDRDAVVSFNDFVFDLKQKIFSGNVVSWKGIGTLSKDLTGQIKFVSSPDVLMFEESVKAQKIMRENTAHTVRVGEEEKTSVEMTEFLNKSKGNRSFWWAYALIIGLIALIFIFWYFSEYGINTNSTGNNKKIDPQPATATYKILP